MLVLQAERFLPNAFTPDSVPTSAYLAGLVLTPSLFTFHVYCSLNQSILGLDRNSTR